MTAEELRSRAMEIVYGKMRMVTGEPDGKYAQDAADAVIRLTLNEVLRIETIAAVPVMSEVAFATLRLEAAVKSKRIHALFPPETK